MSRYGIDYYGIGKYGASVYQNFSSQSFTAYSKGYGNIFLKWDPIGADAWSKLILVRNPYGFPVGPFDGVTVFTTWNDNLLSEYEDTNLIPGRYYYYSLFVYEIDSYSWVKAGDAKAVSVKDWGNTDRLWNYTPSIYKQAAISVAGADYENSTLRSFLNIFGFKLDEIQTVVYLLENRYDLETVDGSLIPLMLKQFGVTYEPELGLQQARILLRDSIQLLKEKGSLQGLQEYIKAFTGYSLSNKVSGTPNPAKDGIVMGHNIMLNYNDSSFEESVGGWEEGTGARLVALSNLTISNVSVTSNVATLTVGAHNYVVGNKITISEALPLFNTSTPVTITAITSTTISYSLTSVNVPSMKVDSGVVHPYPLPWEEPTAVVNYPTKNNGIACIAKETSGTGDITISCGLSNPIDLGVPVTPLTNYTFSFYVASGSTAKSFKATIRWFDRFGVEISPSNSGPSTASTVGVLSNRVSVSHASPALAAYAVPEITVINVDGSLSELHYIDACQFEQSSVVTDFDDARTIHITLKANRTNEITNPNFTPTTNNWAYSGGSAVTQPAVPEPGSDIWPVTYASLTLNKATIETGYIHHIEVGESVYVVGLGAPYDGSHIVTEVTQKEISYAVTNADIPGADVTGFAYHSGSSVELTCSTSPSVVVSTVAKMPIHYTNSSYTFSMYFRTYTGSVVSKASISWYDSSNNLISTSDGEFTTGYDVWNRAYVTAESPANAYSASVSLTLSMAPGDKAIVFGALFERGAFMLDYFDGSGEGEAVSEEDVLWEGGIPNNGRSHFYKNRVAATYRLRETIPNFLTAGSTFAVYLAQPNT